MYILTCKNRTYKKNMLVLQLWISFGRKALLQERIEYYEFLKKHPRSESEDWKWSQNKFETKLHNFRATIAIHRFRGYGILTLNDIKNEFPQNFIDFLVLLMHTVEFTGEELLKYTVGTMQISCWEIRLLMHFKVL